MKEHMQELGNADDPDRIQRSSQIKHNYDKDEVSLAAGFSAPSPFEGR